MNVLDLIETAERLGPTPLPQEIATYEDAEDPGVTGLGWVIENDGSADFALRRMSEGAAEVESIHAQAEAAVAHIRKREAELVEKAQRVVRFMDFKLTEYARANRSKLLRGTKKSKDYIHGRIAYRKKGGRLVVKDREALLAWLATQPVEAGLYRMRLEPEMRALQEQFKTAGEIFPGCEFEPEYEDVVIEAAAPATAMVKP